MTGRLTLAIDQGTHASRALLFDDHGQPIAHAERPVSIERPAPGHSEQDADEILQSVLQAIEQVLGDVDQRQVRAAGLCTQRASVVAWDDTGRALTPVLGWQDRRAVNQLDAVAADADRVRARTGLRLSPHYGAPKLRWLVHEGRLPISPTDPHLRYGPLCSFLLRHLVGGDLLDEANAGRTLLWDLEQRRWDPGLIDRFDLQSGALPDVRPVSSAFGQLLDTAIPLTAVNGDQGAALFAAGPPADDELIVILGTGGFVLAPADTDRAVPGWPASGLLRTLVASDADAVEVALEGTVNGAGAALSWLAGEHGIAAPERLLEGALEETDAPVMFVNSVGGLGSPWWRPGPVTGFADQEPATAAAAVAAVAESILFLVQANIDAIRGLQEQTGRQPRRIRVGGGLAASDRLCQRLADLSGLPVTRPGLTEASARGIAWLAAGRPHSWSTVDDKGRWQPRQDHSLRGRYQRLLDLLGAPTCPSNGRD